MYWIKIIFGVIVSIVVIILYSRFKSRVQLLDNCKSVGVVIVDPKENEYYAAPLLKSLKENDKLIHLINIPSEDGGYKITSESGLYDVSICHKSIKQWNVKKAKKLIEQSSILHKFELVFIIANSQEICKKYATPSNNTRYFTLSTKVLKILESMEYVMNMYLNLNYNLFIKSTESLQSLIQSQVNIKQLIAIIIFKCIYINIFNEVSIPFVKDDLLECLI